GYARVGGPTRREERRLPRMGRAAQPRIGDELEAQPDGALHAGQSRIGVARRPVGRGLEVRVAETAIAALGEDGALAHPGEVGEQGLVVLVEYLRADRNPQHYVGRRRPRAVLAHAVAAGLGFEVLLVAVVDERMGAVAPRGHRAAAAPAVAAVRPAELDELLAPERHRARAAVAGADVHLGL